jgi:hypothetical protein
MCTARTTAPWLALLLMLASVGFGQDQGVLLRHRFTPGQTAQYTVTVSGSGNLQVSGIPIVQAPPTVSLLVNLTAGLTQECTDVDAEGLASLGLKYNDLMMTFDVPNLVTSQLQVTEDGTKLTVNGVERPAPEALGAFLGKALTIKMDDRGRIREVEGIQQVADALKSMGLEGLDLVQLLQQQRGVLPEGPVKVGDTWDEHITIPLTSAGGRTDLDIALRYSFAGLVAEAGQQCARIDFTGTIALGQLGPLSLPQQLPTAGLATNLRLTVLDLAQEIRGTYLFDIANGRMQRADVNQTVSLAGEITGTAHPPQGQPVPFTVTATLGDMTTTATVQLVGVSD